MPNLCTLITDGSSKQSKHAIYCVATLAKSHLDFVLQPVSEVKEWLAIIVYLHA